MNIFSHVTLIVIFSCIQDVVIAAPNHAEQFFNIIGGREAKEGEVPYQVSLRNRFTFDEHFCGGSVLSKRHVVTAAHCCVAIKSVGLLGLFYIGAGVLNKSDTVNMVKREIKSVTIHENYNTTTLENDICLIQIKGVFEFTKKLQRIKLNPKHVQQGTKCVISGWGKWNAESYTTPDPLKVATVPITNDSQCVENYRNFHYVNPQYMICAGYPEGGTDSCQGDSGGPLVCNKKLSGIVSWGYGCAEPGFPGVYTRIQQYIEWLRSKRVELDYFNENDISDSSKGDAASGKNHDISVHN